MRTIGTPEGRMPIGHPSIRAEQYRRLAKECWKLAKMLPPGCRSTVLEMAETWQRLAATDLRQKELAGSVGGAHYDSPGSAAAVSGNRGRKILISRRECRHRPTTRP